MTEKWRERALEKRDMNPDATKTCKVCGEEFQPFLTTQKYCSHKCFYEAQKGDGNTNYRTGLHTARAPRPEMRAFQEKASREGRCRACGATNTVIDAHHAIPRSKWPGTERDNPLNCLPLCKSCHSKWHKMEPLPRSMFTEQELEFLLQANIGQSVEEWMSRRYPEDPDSIIRMCPAGLHELTPENTYPNVSGKDRGVRCRPCRLEARRDALQAANEGEGDA